MQSGMHGVLLCEHENRAWMWKRGDEDLFVKFGDFDLFVKFGDFS